MQYAGEVRCFCASSIQSHPGHLSCGVGTSEVTSCVFHVRTFATWRCRLHLFYLPKYYFISTCIPFFLEFFVLKVSFIFPSWFSQPTAGKTSWAFRVWSLQFRVWMGKKRFSTASMHGMCFLSKLTTNMSLKYLYYLRDSFNSNIYSLLLSH